MLAIVTTHPIQYQTPIWQALAADGRVPFEVWYLTDFGVKPSLDVEFGKTFSWDIDILANYPRRFLKTAKGASPVDFLRCRLTERLRDRIRGAGVTAVWIQGWQVAGYWQAVREAKKAGAQVWLRAESNDLAHTPRWKQPIKRVVLGRLFAQIDKFFYVGAANRRLYGKFGVQDSRLIRAPYAVDNARFAAQGDALRAQRKELRRAWNIPENAFCVLFCGKFIGKKRPLDLVSAAQVLRVSGRLPDIHLLFCGAGELGHTLRKACTVVYDADGGETSSAAAADPPASFAGFLNQTEISRAYVAADCLALPSDQGETWGLVVNEAMASGLPCVVSDACGCAEDLAGPEQTYPLRNIDALAERLYVLSTNRPAWHPSLPSFQDTVSAVIAAYDGARGEQR